MDKQKKILKFLFAYYLFIIMIFLYFGRDFYRKYPEHIVKKVKNFTTINFMLNFFVLLFIFINMFIKELDNYITAISVFFAGNCVIGIIGIGITSPHLNYPEEYPLYYININQNKLNLQTKNYNQTADKIIDYLNISDNNKIKCWSYSDGCGDIPLLAIALVKEFSNTVFKTNYSINTECSNLECKITDFKNNCTVHYNLLQCKDESYINDFWESRTGCYDPEYTKWFKNSGLDRFGVTLDQ